jgi:hypothetical protein
MHSISNLLGMVSLVILISPILQGKSAVYLRNEHGVLIKSPKDSATSVTYAFSSDPFLSGDQACNGEVFIREMGRSNECSYSSNE